MSSGHTEISSADMKAAGFAWDPTQSGHERWTHFQKDITCLRQPYMTDQEWNDHKRECIAKAHPS